MLYRQRRRLLESCSREECIQYVKDAEAHCEVVVKQAVRGIRGVKVDADDIRYTNYNGLSITDNVRVSVKDNSDSFEVLDMVFDAICNLERNYSNGGVNDAFIKWMDWDGGYTESLRSQNLFHFDIDFGINIPDGLEQFI